MYKAARRIVEKLRRHGHEALFAGGWVRDHLLGRRPKDIDIATSALPPQVHELFPHSLAVGASFGVVLVRMYGRCFEVATFRAEGPYEDGRHPSTVSFAGMREDAFRRDFTINGMFFDPLSGRVIDLVQGRKDLRHRIVRTIGLAGDRFAEDKLRMLRAVRFACALDFSIASGTAAAIRQHAPEILQVSWERIRDELLATLVLPSRARGLALWHELGLLEQVLPEVAAMDGVSQPEDYHPEGDVFTHTRAALSLLRNPSPVLALATLLHDVGKPPTHSIAERIRFDGHVEVGAQMTEAICRRLRLSSDHTEQTVDLVRNHLRFMHVQEMRRSTLRRFLRKPNFADHLELHRVDCRSSHRSLENYRFCRGELEAMRREPPHPERLITGRDLIGLGLRPGPLYGQILRQVEDLQLEGALKTRDEAFDFVRGRFLAEGKTSTPE
jgi:putative nucleotidyltransferase with HDIG domain